MLKRFLKDESGVALGLAVVMIVLIGVMGAGLLVFVRNDLEAVVEVNQGQRATDVAEAGLHVGKEQILGDKIPAHYDVDDSTDPTYLDSTCNVDNADPDESIARTPDTENWSPEAGGQTRTFAGGEFTVTIRWLAPDATAPDDCRAPETGTLPEGTDYFKVVSTGRHGGAVRRVEAIYETYRLNVPRAYYTPGPITINGDACISEVSIFSLNDIKFSGGGNGCADPDADGDTVQDDGTSDPKGINFRGNDLYYGDWNRPPYNTIARPVTVAGAGTARDISGSPQMLDPTDPSKKIASRSTRDFDRYTSPPFKQSPSTGEMTFPFDLASQPDANLLCDEAKAQGNYTANSGSGNASLLNWPSSNPNTVVCYEFTKAGSHVLNWKVDDDPDTDLTDQGYTGCTGPIQEGTLIVKGGGFSVSPNTDLFRGVVVVRGSTEDSEVQADLSGKGCMDGFINSTGPITISGSITPSNSDNVNDRPGFYGVRTWSWRELYE